MNYEKVNKYPLIDYQFKDALKEIEWEKSFTNELFKHIKFVAKKGKDNRNILQRMGFKEDIVVATDGYRLIKTDLIPYIRNGNNYIENESIVFHLINHLILYGNLASYYYQSLLLLRMLLVLIYLYLGN